MHQAKYISNLMITLFVVAMDMTSVDAFMLKDSEGDSIKPSRSLSFVMEPCGYGILWKIDFQMLWECWIITMHQNIYGLVPMRHTKMTKRSEDGYCPNFRV